MMQISFSWAFTKRKKLITLKNWPVDTHSSFIHNSKLEKPRYPGGMDKL